MIYHGRFMADFFPEPVSMDQESLTKSENHVFRTKRHFEPISFSSFGPFGGTSDRRNSYSRIGCGRTEWREMTDLCFKVVHLRIGKNELTW